MLIAELAESTIQGYGPGPIVIDDYKLQFIRPKERMSSDARRDHRCPAAHRHDRAFDAR